MIDAASGGALGDMTPFEARNFFIEKMASNSQQFSAINDAIVLRGVHEVAMDSSSSTENKKLQQGSYHQELHHWQHQSYSSPCC